MAVHLAPWDADGNLITFPGYLQDVTWKENAPFETVLHLKGMERGRSAANFIWEDFMRRRYVMFMTDFVELVQTRELSRGRTRREMWVVKKRGQNYGIGLAYPKVNL